jgi:hypothetical protein
VKLQNLRKLAVSMLLILIDLPASLKKRPATPSRKATAAAAAEAAALPPWRRLGSSSSHEVIRARIYIYIYILEDRGVLE